MPYFKSIKNKTFNKFKNKTGTSFNKTGKMVEVFKTNVKDEDHARILLDQIHQTFIGYKANFDLDDCDKILRVECSTEFIIPSSLINLLYDFGFHAEVLPGDDYMIDGILSDQSREVFGTS